MQRLHHPSPNVKPSDPPFTRPEWSRIGRRLAAALRLQHQRSPADSYSALVLLRTSDLLIVPRDAPALVHTIAHALQAGAAPLGCIHFWPEPRGTQPGLAVAITLLPPWDASPFRDTILRHLSHAAGHMVRVLDITLKHAVTKDSTAVPLAEGLVRGYRDGQEGT